MFKWVSFHRCGFSRYMAFVTCVVALAPRCVQLCATTADKEFLTKKWARPDGSNNRNCIKQWLNTDQADPFVL